MNDRELNQELGLPNFTHESEDIANELNGVLSDPEHYLLLEQSIAKIALDLEAIKAQLDFAYKRGVVADHSRLLVWQAKENIAKMIDRLNKMTD
jgi:hypothetical protein